MKRIAASLLAVCAFAAQTVIESPESFVKKVYHALATSPSYTPPDDIYTPRLRSLMQKDRRQSKGEVGCLDGVFWVNAQDWQLSDVKVTALPETKGRQVVVATFRNLGKPEEIRFEFQRVAGVWRLDEARSTGADAWTLTQLLNCKP
jgi:hypothetical protein